MLLLCVACLTVKDIMQSRPAAKSPPESPARIPLERVDPQIVALKNQRALRLACPRIVYFGFQGAQGTGGSISGEA